MLWLQTLFNDVSDRFFDDVDFDLLIENFVRAANAEVAATRVVSINVITLLSFPPLFYLLCFCILTYLQQNNKI